MKIALILEMKEGGENMELIISGIIDDALENSMTIGMCTEEPGDNCWLQLD